MNKRKSRNTKRKNKRRGGYISKGEKKYSENYSEYMKLYDNKGIRNTREAMDYAIEQSNKKNIEPRKTRQSRKTRQTRKTRQRKSMLDNYNKLYSGQKEYLERKNLRSTRDIIDHLNKDNAKDTDKDTYKKPKTMRKSIKDVKPSGFVKEIGEVTPDGKDYKLTGKIFNLIETGGGGDCFFHAVAYLVFDDKNKHFKVRSDMCEWVKKNGDKLINQDINGLPIYILMSIQGGGGNKKQIAGSKSKEEQNKIIDNYIKTMGRRGTWAEGVLEYYFVCKSLFDKYGKKIKMMVYTYPCIPDPKVKSGKKCLRNIKYGYRENFCTIVPDGQFQNTIFEDDENGLIKIHLLNQNQGHFRALVPKST